MLTVKQAAERLGVSPALIYALCRRRAIDHLRLGLGRGAVRISEEALAEFQDRCTARIVGGGGSVRPPVLPPLRHVRLSGGTSVSR